MSRVREGCKESAEEEDEENEENDGEVEVEHPRGRLGHPSSEYILTQKNGVHKRRLRLRFQVGLSVGTWRYEMVWDRFHGVFISCTRDHTPRRPRWTLMIFWVPTPTPSRTP